MPEFAPSESRRAIAPITVSPAGLGCAAELYLVSNSTKIVTSGLKLFTSSGGKQDITFPITMPSSEGAYPVWLDVFAEGMPIGAYEATEDVVILAPVPEFVYVSGIRSKKERHKWVYDGYRREEYLIAMVDVKNQGTASGACSLWCYSRCNQTNMIWLNRGEVRATLAPGEVKTFAFVAESIEPPDDSWGDWAYRNVEARFVGPPGTKEKRLLY